MQFTAVVALTRAPYLVPPLGGIFGHNPDKHREERGSQGGAWVVPLGQVTSAMQGVNAEPCR